MSRPQFTLKAILGVTAALSVPLAVIAAGFHLLGVVILLLVAVGSIAYLMDGRKGLAQAVVATGIVLTVIGGWVLFTVVYLYLNKNP